MTVLRYDPTTGMNRNFEGLGEWARECDFGNTKNETAFTNIAR